MKKLETHHKIIAGIILVYIIFQLVLFLQLKELPSPLFGGDYYHSMGQIQHTIDGGNPFLSSHALGGVVHYMPMYTIIVACINLVLPFLSVMSAMFVGSLLITIGAIIFSYLFFSDLFDNKYIGIISTLIFIPLTRLPIWKYMDFAMIFMYPLVFYLLLRFFKTQSWKNAILFGLSWGVLGISHSVGFVGMCFFIAIFTLISMWSQVGKIRYLLQMAVAGLCALPIALLFWFRPIFEFHGKTLNPLNIIDFPIFDTFSKGMEFVVETFKHYFFGIGAPNIIYGIISILAFLGFVLIFFKEKIDKKDKFVLFFLISAFMTVFHYFVTQVILGTSFSPQYMKTFFFPIIMAIGFGYFIKSITEKEFILQITIIVLVIILCGLFMSKISSDRWINAGKAEMPEEYKQLQKWVLDNTEVNDVFLTNNELAHALNGLTGRKTTTLRRGHTGIFIDANKNMLATALILYSNNTETIKKYLKENNVKYLYWNIRWINLEFTFTDGKISSIFDPLMLLDNETTKNELEKNGISYYQDNTYLDPAARSYGINTYDVLIITPESYDNKPWSDELDSMLEEVWNFHTGDLKTSVIYRVDIDGN